MAAIFEGWTADRDWYEIGVRPTLDKFLDRLPVLKKVDTSALVRAC